FILAGMAYHPPNDNANPATECASLAGYNPIRPKNIYPFLHTIEIDFSPNTTPANPNIYGTVVYNPNGVSFLTLYPTMNGTGDPALVNNSYADLGGGMSH